MQRRPLWHVGAVSGLVDAFQARIEKIQVDLGLEVWRLVSRGQVLRSGVGLDGSFVGRDAGQSLGVPFLCAR